MIPSKSPEWLPYTYFFKQCIRQLKAPQDNSPQVNYHWNCLMSLLVQLNYRNGYDEPFRNRAAEQQLTSETTHGKNKKPSLQTQSTSNMSN